MQRNYDYLALEKLKIIFEVCSKIIEILLNVYIMDGKDDAISPTLMCHIYAISILDAKICNCYPIYKKRDLGERYKASSETGFNVYKAMSGWQDCNDVSWRFEVSRYILDV